MTGRRQYPLLTNRNAGFALAELMLSMMIAASLFASIAFYLSNAQTEKATSEHAKEMAQYVNAVGAYIAAQGTTPPSDLSRTGTDWLKSTTCGGEQPVDASYLSCNIPTNFNSVYGLGAPEVTFDWSSPKTPTALIDFGATQAQGENDTVAAAQLAMGINDRLEVDGYEHARTFIIDDAQPLSSELAAANIRVEIDTSIESTVFVRRDGNTVMTGTLVNESPSWAVVARTEDGTENADPRSNASSLNINDIYARSVDSWFSETHEAADEALRRSLRAPNYVGLVRTGSQVNRPTCPAPLMPKLYATPAGVVGGTSINDAQSIKGIRVRTTPAWRVHLETLHSKSGTWQEVPHPQMGLIQVMTRCSE